jgi:aromatic-amino-acid transaminase
MRHLIESRQNRPTDDPIFALNREATERRKKGESIVNATVGALLDDAGKLAILPTSARAIREVPEDAWAAYAPIAGAPDFQKAVLDDLLGASPALRASATATATPGGSGALRHAIANWLLPGQALLTTSFYWGPYQTLADEADRKLQTFAMFGSDGKIDVGAFDRALGELLLRQDRALIFLNDPCHNPTGYSMRPEEWRDVVKVLLRHGAEKPVTVLLDVAYAAYGATDISHVLREVEPLLGKVGLLLAWSASKQFTHYGLRVGALVVCEPDEVARASTAAALSYSCRGTWSNCNAGGMRAITRLLTEPALKQACDEERAKLHAMLRARVAAFNTAASAKGLKYPRYEGGFFVTVFHDDAQKKAAELREQGIYVVPTGKGLRIGLCSVAEADVPRLVAALD